MGDKRARTVEEIDDAEIRDNGTSRGAVYAMRVALAAGKARILARQR